MAFPSTLTLVSVHAAFDVPPGGGAGGTVTFTADRPLQGGADNSIVPPFSVTAVLDADGEFTAQLPATDDPQWSPSGWAYRVDLLVSGSVFSGTLQLAYGSATAELADLLQVSGAAQTGVTYIPFAQRSVAGGVAALDADGDVVKADGTKVTGGGTPSATVSSGTAFGAAASAGADAAYSRGDHAHGTPVNPVTAHVAASDPHTQYPLKSIATTKGDLLIATAAGVLSRVGVGSNNQVLTADSSTTEGARWATPAASGTTTVNVVSSRQISQGYVTSGNLTPQNTAAAWALLTGGPTFTVPAAVGDVVTFTWAGLIQYNSSTFYDPAVVVGGAAVRYASSGTATPAIEGDPALLPDQNFQKHNGTFSFTAVGGDISGGVVTVRFAVKSGGAGTLYASTAYPMRWQLVSESVAPAMPWYTQHLLATGEEVFSRELLSSGSVVLGSGTMRLTHFTARKSETINTLRTVTGGVAAATVTLARKGIYQIDGSGNGTLLAAIASDTSLYGGTGSGYNRALTSPFTKVAGQRYAFGVLVVAATPPQMLGSPLANTSEPFALAPTICASLTGQTDLPASFTAGSLSASGNRIHGIMLP